jgi:hypothetical protein
LLVFRSDKMEWIAFFMSATAFSLVLQQMEKIKKLEKRIEELEG